MSLFYIEENNIILKAVDRFHSKLQALNPKYLEISDYNKDYLIKYLNNFYFYMSSYKQLLQKAVRKLIKPVSESTFIDYGGGCGLLSFLAKETGFRTVIYNDINNDSVKDAQHISKKLGITIDLFIPGDVDDLINEINNHSISPDLICSFDVLEHIYDLESWIKSIAGLNREFYLLFMTSANSCNPFIFKRLKNLHEKSEYQGYEKNIRHNESFLNTSFLEERKKIINNKFPGLKEEEVNLLALKSRGLIKDLIEKLAENYIGTGKVIYKIEHPTNTCDPYTGSWTEKLIDIKHLRRLITSYGLYTSISNSFYGYNNNKLLNAIKYMLNLAIRVTGPGNLLISPTFTLEICKSNTKKI